MHKWSQIINHLMQKFSPDLGAQLSCTVTVVVTLNPSSCRICAAEWEDWNTCL